MAARFNIPASIPVNHATIDNFLGMDSKNLTPSIQRASEMYNFIKQDGLHQVRPVLWQLADVNITGTKTITVAPTYTFQDLADGPGGTSGEAQG